MKRNNSHNNFQNNNNNNRSRSTSPHSQQTTRRFNNLQRQGQTGGGGGNNNNNYHHQQQPRRHFNNNNDPNETTNFDWIQANVAKKRAIGYSRGDSVGSNASRRSLGVSSSTSSAGFNSGFNISFGNFEFRELRNSKDGKKGGGIRKLYNDLSRAKKEKTRMDAALETEEGLDIRRESLLEKAQRKLGGEKIRDDPKYLQRKLTKRRAKKKKSAKEWAKRKEDLQKSVDEAVEKHGKAGIKGMNSANRARRVAMKHAKTSAGRKEAARRTDRISKQTAGGKKRGK